MSFHRGHNDTLVSKILQITHCSPFDPELALQCHAEQIKGVNRIMEVLKCEPNIGRIRLKSQRDELSGIGQGRTSQRSKRPLEELFRQLHMLLDICL